jgi:hypothetical protein
VLSSRASTRGQILAASLLIVAGLVAVVLTRGGSASTPARPHLASMFQDDDHLLYAPDATVNRTLDELRGLGVDQIRATVLWKNLAPDAASTTRPANFNARSPSAYAASAWVPYDRLVQQAGLRGITVDFDLTAPGPLWAMAGGAPAAKYQDHWSPSAQEFGSFVAAMGTRYSGRYIPAGANRPLPRVSFWSVWNEPNQQGWLTPQYQSVRGQPVMQSAALYRAYADAAFTSLAQTGHLPASDTILVGELAPEGSVQPTYDFRDAIPPIPFLRGVYCVDGSYRPLSGAAASAIGCPTDGNTGKFVAAHPALFQANGFAHHPYSFFLSPSTSMAEAGFAPLANLTRLESELDSIFNAYGVSRQIPLYLTEYGYETYPPNPWRGVSLRLQSLYLNEAQYMAWRDPRVRTMSQFLLYDALPDSAAPKGSQKYWSTFQTGLRFASGQAKPSLNSYRLPLFVPNPVLSGGSVLVWGMLRAAPPGTRQQAQIQWGTQSGTGFRTLNTVTTDSRSQVFVATVKLPGPGVVRVAWTSSSGQVMYSRRVGVRSG